MIKPSRIAWMAVACLGLWAGCKGPVTETSQDFEGACWQLTDTLSVSFEAPDPAAQYQVGLPITLNEDYPYNNLHIRFEAVAPSGKSSVVPYEYELMDVEGNWYGEVSGSTAKFELPLSMGQSFAEEGTYTFRVWHYFQSSDLCGIPAAGITVRKTQ